MLFNLKTAAINDETGLYSFESMIKIIFDHVTLSIGSDRLMSRIELEEKIEKLKQEVPGLLKYPLVIRKIRSENDRLRKELKLPKANDKLHLGVFLRGVSAAPLVNISVADRNASDGKVLVNIYPWQFDENVFFAKTADETTYTFIYPGLRSQTKQLIAQLKALIPELFGEKYFPIVNFFK